MEREQGIEGLIGLGITIVLFFVVLLVVVIITQRRRLFLKRALARQLENECMMETKKLEGKLQEAIAELDEVKKQLK